MSNSTPLPLGRTVPPPTRYDPNLLYPILRKDPSSTYNNSSLPLPQGIDRWDCYEVSWLSPSGAPRIAHLTLSYSGRSAYIVESKSLKLYLMSLNQERFKDTDRIKDLVTQDVSEALHGEPITVSISSVMEGVTGETLLRCGQSVDGETTAIEIFHPTASLIQVEVTRYAKERLYMSCFRSLCPVTAQPDWATIVIDYTGPKLNRECLFSYLSSYRMHQGFHEECADIVYSDLITYGKCDSLAVGCYFVRRGGIAITPVRWTSESAVSNDLKILRLLRQ